MKIVLVVSSMAQKYGGIPYCVIHYARSLTENGCTVTTVTTDEGMLDGEREKTIEEFESYNIKIQIIQNTRFGKFAYSNKFCTILEKEAQNANIIHSFGIYFYSSYCAGKIAKKLSIPMIIKPCGILDPYIFNRHRYRKKIIELLFENSNINSCAAIHYTAEEEKKVSAYSHLNKKAYILPIPITDFSKFHKKPSTPKSIIFLSRISFKKGLDTLIDAYKTLKNDQSHNVRLLIVGPDDENLIQKFMNETNFIKYDIEYLGPIYGDKKLETLSNCYVFALSSSQENFAISVFESLSCGVPVVISDKINTHEVITDKKMGLVCKKDSKLLSEQLATILKNEELRETFSKNGMNYVKEELNHKKVGQKLIEMYNNVLIRR